MRLCGVWGTVQKFKNSKKGRMKHTYTSRTEGDGDPVIDVGSGNWRSFQLSVSREERQGRQRGNKRSYVQICAIIQKRKVNFDFITFFSSGNCHLATQTFPMKRNFKHDDTLSQQMEELQLRMQMLSKEIIMNIYFFTR
jgi:hypothetical protein